MIKSTGSGKLRRSIEPTSPLLRVFIRDITRIGMGLSSNSDPAIQVVSNTIGLRVYQQILADSAISAFGTQLTVQADITTDRRRLIEFFLSPVVNYMDED
jgi:hypothetical protein